MYFNLLLLLVYYLLLLTTQYYYYYYYRMQHDEDLPAFFNSSGAFRVEVTTPDPVVLSILPSVRSKYDALLPALTIV